ncbi:putative replication initiation protein [Sulfolobales Beppu rod-shaped virus 1]|uniref:Putative replication initiation protein n=1 Tax=Sulfolobales Beppu rod-shaped virus 1 TaxID=2493121 RepID=A0A3S8NF87_9VIRU|nr:putative replication initiation protein [Sulfolobales Beppu rod-shaped virus 1]AZI75900.1 putative replication initiation protein [Sulfolobales Beppu rod-shaped virus 1]
MKLKNVEQLHFSYAYTYFITISSRYQFIKAREVYRLVYRFLNNHDINAKIRSVKEFTKKTKEEHFHILYFTNKKLEYKKLHNYLKKHNLQHYDINIQIVRKTIDDIKNVKKYMLKFKVS